MREVRDADNLHVVRSICDDCGLNRPPLLWNGEGNFLLALPFLGVFTF